MTTTSKATAAVIGALVLGTSGVAAAAWSSPGSGAGSSGAVTVSAPGAPTAPAPTSTSVSLSWAAAAGGGASYRYHVERALYGGATWTDVCGSTDALPITGTSCTDTGAAGTDFQYRVTAELGSWRKVSTTSAKISVPAAMSITGVSPTTGTTHTSVTLTISGTGFQPGASVSFNGGQTAHTSTAYITGTPSAVTSTSITVTVTISSSTNAVGYYDLTVANPNSGGSTTRVGAFQVTS